MLSLSSVKCGHAHAGCTTCHTHNIIAVIPSLSKLLIDKVNLRNVYRIILINRSTRDVPTSLHFVYISEHAH